MNRLVPVAALAAALAITCATGASTAPVARQTVRSLHQRAWTGESLTARARATSG